MLLCNRILILKPRKIRIFSWIHLQILRLRLRDFENFGTVLLMDKWIKSQFFEMRWLERSQVMTLVDFCSLRSLLTQFWLVNLSRQKSKNFYRWIQPLILGILASYSTVIQIPLHFHSWWLNNCTYFVCRVKSFEMSLLKNLQDLWLWPQPNIDKGLQVDFSIDRLDCDTPHERFLEREPPTSWLIYYLYFEVIGFVIYL